MHWSMQCHDWLASVLALKTSTLITAIITINKLNKCSLDGQSYGGQASYTQLLAGYPTGSYGPKDATKHS